VLTLTNGDTNIPASPKISPLRRISTETVDNTDHVIHATSRDDQLQSVTRSGTALSLEERSIETSPRPRDAGQGLDTAIELEIAPYRASAQLETHTERQSPPLHEQDFSNDWWYRSIVLVNFLLISCLSGGILSGAGSTGNYDGIFGNPRDVGSLFLGLLQWVAIFVPLPSWVICFSYVSVRPSTDTTLGRLHAVACRVYLYHLGTSVAAIIRLFTNGRCAPSVVYFIMTLVFYSTCFLICCIAHIVISIKLKRETRTWVANANNSTEG
jgi:hypothetical protein